jgi:hypothetical protein
MLRVGSSALPVGLLGIAIAGAAGQGCTGKRATELVPGVFSQVQVPRNIAAIRLDLKANGRPAFCSYYDVTGGTVLLPATLGVIPSGSPQTVVTVEIRGYDGATLAKNNNDAMGCTGVGLDDTANGGPRILRRSIQSYVDQHTLFLPMQLSYSCFDQCAPDDGSKTCKGGQCVDAKTDPTTLVDFDPTLVDGKGVCFSPTQCFVNATPAVAIDADNCVYGVPGLPPSTPVPGLNVRVFYQDLTWAQNTGTGTYETQVTDTGEEEVLNQDAVEGFSLLPNGQFQLAPGLCSLAKASAAPPTPPTTGTSTYRAISTVLVSVGCPAKSPLVPICLSERSTASTTAEGGATRNITCNVPVPLVPAPSAVYMVMDDSSEMNGAFGQSGYATAMGLSLGAPIFKRTYVAFQFLQHVATDCTSTTTTFTMPQVKFGLALANQPAIADKLLHWQAPQPTMPQDLYLEAATRPEGAYSLVSQFAAGMTQLNESLEVGAVMFFVNRMPLSFQPADAGGGPDGGVAPTQSLDCPGSTTSNPDPVVAAQAAIQARVTAAATANPRVSTYFVVLDNASHTPPLGFFQGITGATVLDATSSSADQVLYNFANAASSLGTCLYELPPDVDTTAKIGFGPANTQVPFSSACNEQTAGTADGWNIDNHRIRVCGASCTTIRNAVLGLTASALAMDASVPDLAVTATMACATP